MTDGEPTVGASHASKLCEYLSSTFEHFFLGFNSNHNSKLLYDLCLRTNGHYYFIDSPENSSLIYGEILHKFLYRTNKLSLSSTGKVLFYDYKTNNWLSTYNYGYIGSDDTVSIHYKFNWDTNPEDLTFSIHSVNIDSKEETYSVYSVISDIDTVYDKETTTTCETRNMEIEKYYYRQHVLETLFTCLQNQVYNNTILSNMEQLFEKIKKFCEVNDLMEDTFMNQLKDDLSMVYTTSQYGNAFDTPYCLARHVSQGSQTAYNVHNINVDSGTGIISGISRSVPTYVNRQLSYQTPMTPTRNMQSVQPLIRQNQYSFVNSAGDPTQQNYTPGVDVEPTGTPSILTHIRSRDSTSAYATDHQTQVMDAISEDNH